MSFNKQLLTYIVAHPACDLSMVTKGVGLNPSSKTDRERVSVRLGMLVHDKRLTRKGGHYEGRWTATADALVDRRSLRAKPKPAAKPKAKAVRAIASPATATAKALPPRSAPLPPKPPADCPSRQSLVRVFQPTKRSGELTSEQIAADIAAFEQRGGRIEVLGAGAASKPLRTVHAEASYAAVNERAWRERVRRLADTEPTNDDDVDLDDVA